MNVPAEAATVNVYYSGLGFSGSRIGPDHVTDVGMGFTLAIHFGLTPLFMAAGVPTLSDTISSILAVSEAAAAQLVTLLGSTFNSEGTSLIAAGVTIMEGFLNGLAGKGLTKLITIILTKMTAAQLITVIPVAGQIARAAAIIGAALAVSLSRRPVLRQLTNSTYVHG